MSVPLREHQIQDDRVILDRLGLEPALLAVIGNVDSVPFFLQSLLEGAYQSSIVFDQEDAHGTPRKGAELRKVGERGVTRAIPSPNSARQFPPVWYPHGALKAYESWEFALISASKRRTILVAASAGAEADRSLAALGAEFLPVDVQLLQSRIPVPALSLHEVHDEEVLQLLQFRKAKTVGGRDRRIQVDRGLDFRVPALGQFAPEGGIRWAEFQHKVDPARPFERPIDQVEGTIGGEDKHHAFVYFNSVEGAQEHRLIVGLVDSLPIAQGDIHVVEKNDPAFVDGEQLLNAVIGARLPVSVGSDQTPLPHPPPALLPDPAAGRSLPIPRRAHQQDAAPRPAAILRDLGQVRPLQVPDRVFPKCVDLVLGEHRRLPWRFLVALATQRNTKELDVLRTADGGKNVGPIVLLVVVTEQHAAETHAFDFKYPHTQVH